MAAAHSGMKPVDVPDSRKTRLPPADHVDAAIQPAARREPPNRLTAAVAAPTLPPADPLPLTDHNLSASPGGRTLASSSSTSSSPPCGGGRGGLSSPHSSLPDQNSNSVRDLEAAMSKHLPKNEEELQLQHHHHHHQPPDPGSGLEAAAAAMMVRPTAVEPVKATLSISIWEARAAPTNLFRSFAGGIKNSKKFYKFRDIIRI